MLPLTLFSTFSFGLLYTYLVRAQTFSLSKHYSGSSFFDDWTYTSGGDEELAGTGDDANVHWLTKDQAISEGLTVFNSTTNRVTIKVDNVKAANPGDTSFGRDSVYITTNDSFPIGSLIILDAVHIPYGCSVWPAFFTRGPNWPTGGEIDIIENVNMATNNRYALHTDLGCTASGPSSQMSGALQQNIQCGNPDPTQNIGCVIQDSDTSSFGSGFASIQGGVFATWLDEAGFKMWFFERSKIPSDITSGSPNPSGWGLPSAFYPASTCNPDQFFTPQTLIFDIRVCGSFPIGVFSNTCANVAPNCTSMVGTPSNYDNAFFDINYLSVFSNSSSGSSSVGGSSPTATSSPSSGGSSGSGTTSTSGSGATGGSKNSAAAKLVNSSILLWTFVSALTATITVFASI